MVPQDDGFELIWLYWYQKYMRKERISSKKSYSMTDLKQHYQIEAIEPQNNQQLFDQKLLQIKQKAILSRNSSFYIIDPEEELKEILAVIENAFEHRFQELITQLYSYYLNIRNIFVIYKSEARRESMLTNSLILATDNSSEGNNDRSKGSKASKSSVKVRDTRTQNNNSVMGSADIINKLVNSNEDDSHEGRVESLLIDTYDKFQNKIDDLEVLDVLAETDGLKLWNCKFKQIPHTFIKLKKNTWVRSFNLPLMHPSQPKAINDYPIVPSLKKLRPSPDKLLPFISYLRMLDKFYPQLSPTIESIYEYNNLPYIFVEEGNAFSGWNWESNAGLLCYYVVFGNDSGDLTLKKVERWVEENEDTFLAKTIKQLNKKQKSKHIRIKKENEWKGLGFMSDADDPTEIIW